MQTVWINDAEAERLAQRFTMSTEFALARILQENQRDDENARDDGRGALGQWEAMMLRL